MPLNRFVLIVREVDDFFPEYRSRPVTTPLSRSEVESLLSRFGEEVLHWAKAPTLKQPILNTDGIYVLGAGLVVGARGEAKVEIPEVLTVEEWFARG